MLKGRLGLETARIPHADRAGLLWLSRGALTARDGTLAFERGENATRDDPLEPRNYSIPFQRVSMILLGPGSTVSHDALRLLARHGTALAAVGQDGVRCYTAPPLIARRSDLARRQAGAWADPDARLGIARRMYAWRLGRVLPHRDITVLRGIEGARMKESYRLIAGKVGIPWQGRRYDRSRPSAGDLPESGAEPRVERRRSGSGHRRLGHRHYSATWLHPRRSWPVLRTGHLRSVPRFSN